MRHNKVIATVVMLAIVPIAWVGSSAPANALSWGACSTLALDASKRLTSNDGCNLNSPGDVSNPSLPDFDGLFGVNDWVAIGTKVDVEEEDVDGTDEPISVNLNQNLSQGSLSFTSNNRNFSGEWSISQALLNQYAKVAIVMKDGDQKPAPTIAYLISGTSGTWRTPWISGDGTDYSSENNSLSNVRFIGQGVGVIPLPAAAWLLIAAFGALGAAARIKKKHSMI